jgi:hypothetical protein
MKLVTLILVALSMNAIAAEPRLADVLLGDLTRCDRKFFETLGQQRGELSSNPHFRIARSLGFFDVQDRGDLNHSLRRFDTPTKIGSLDAIGYFDEVLELGDANLFLSWGFLIRAPAAEVVRSTRALIWENERLRKDQAVHVRSEIWTHSNAEKGWVRAATVADQSPAAGTVERVLLIEPLEDDASLTRFGCSLQGAVTREMIRSERPDLAVE